MDARGEIASVLWLSVPSADDEEAKAKAEQMLDAFAHELAEKIREADGPGAPGLFVGGFWWDDRDRDHAADLIDPNKS